MVGAALLINPEEDENICIKPDCTLFTKKKPSMRFKILQQPCTGNTTGKINIMQQQQQPRVLAHQKFRSSFLPIIYHAVISHKNRREEKSSAHNLTAGGKVHVTVPARRRRS